MTSIVPSASLSLYLHPFLPALSLCSSLPPSLSNCPPLSGDLAEAKCFLLSRCRWDCNKACQWEAWVALSHALCLPSVNSLQPTTTLPIPVPSNPSARRSLPKTLCFYSPHTHTHTHTHTPPPHLSAFSSLISPRFHPKPMLLDLSLMSLYLSGFLANGTFREHDEEEQQQETPPLHITATHKHIWTHTNTRTQSM